MAIDTDGLRELYGLYAVPTICGDVCYRKSTDFVTVHELCDKGQLLLHLPTLDFAVCKLRYFSGRVAGAFIVTLSARRSKANRNLPSNVFSVVDFRVEQCRSGANHPVNLTGLPSSIHTF